MRKDVKLPGPSPHTTPRSASGRRPAAPRRRCIAGKSRSSRPAPIGTESTPRRAPSTHRATVPADVDASMAKTGPGSEIVCTGGFYRNTRVGPSVPTCRGTHWPARDEATRTAAVWAEGMGAREGNEANPSSVNSARVANVPPSASTTAASTIEQSSAAPRSRTLLPLSVATASPSRDGCVAVSAAYTSETAGTRAVHVRWTPARRDGLPQPSSRS